MFGKRFVPVFFQQQILLHSVPQNKPVFMPVFRDAGQPVGVSELDRFLGNVNPLYFDRAFIRLHQAGKRLDQFILAVAVNSGNAEDLAEKEKKSNILFAVSNKVSIFVPIK